MKELKAKFGKYKAMDVENYLVELKRAYETKLEGLSAQVQQLETENAELKAKVEENESRQSVIARVMLDATVRAKEIEEDYKARAQESDSAYDQLHREWVEGMQSCSANLEKMRGDAKTMLDAIDRQFGSLCSWADSRLEALEKIGMPQLGEASLERQIAFGAGADLQELCQEMGYAKEADATETPKEEAGSDGNA